MRRSPISAWKQWREWRARQSRLVRICIWLACFYMAVMVVHLLSRRFLGVVTALLLLSGTAFCVFLCAWILRWISRRLLWKVRNRLIVTYLLMGAAPIVLFATLAGLAAYLLAGQFATNMALSAIDQTSKELGSETGGVAYLTAHKAMPAGPLYLGETVSPGIAATSLATLGPDHAWHALPAALVRGRHGASPVDGLPSPSWLQPGFHGLVALSDRLYLCDDVRVEGIEGRVVEMLGSLPVDSQTVAGIASPLGRVLLLPGFSFVDNDEGSAGNEQNFNLASGDRGRPFRVVRGGVVPSSEHFIDPRVYFTAPASVVSWTSGRQLPASLVVISRPSVLYRRLFAASTRIGSVVRYVLLSVALLFAVIEVIALLLALGLSRTITRSVADLYRATMEVDRGNLGHRVAVRRPDQLGALASSFNSMAASIQDLLVQQREKDRILNELAIAQEVQRNLFPHSPVSSPGFEMHGVCMPARTVSGDYFDFIFGQGTGICVALGDISGKGISAALLMASLHSAVRAFSLGAANGGGATPSPALLLRLLNRHLYRSTQPEKYATLFLSFYDSATRKLTYSNAGHLPPLLISADRKVRRLDCGGSVVGLFDGLEYVEETVEMQTGDLLLIYTDGITEPENDSGDFGEQRLLDCVWQHRQQSLPDLASSTLQVLKQWIGPHEQPDDMTLLLVRQL